MQVFIVGSPLETAMALDKRRLNRQLQEVKVILAALNGAKAWSNHPCVLQYRGCESWLRAYYGCLYSYVRNEEQNAILYSELADAIRPDWHDQRYYDNMKARLFTKNPQHYAQWADLGKTDENWYFVDGVWLKYVNGKRI